MPGNGWKSLALAAAPACAVLAVLVGTDRLALGPAALLFAAVLLGVGIAVRRRVKAEGATMNRLHRLTAEAQTRLSDLTHKVAMADRLIAALPDPILFLGENRIVVRANAAAIDLLGDLTGRDLADGLRDPKLLDAIDKAYKAKGGEGADVPPVEITVPAPVEAVYQARVERVEDPSGERRAGLAMDGPTMDGHMMDGHSIDGLAPVLLVDLQDVTALVRSERMRADFVANVSHELRTPLTSLGGFIETLRGPARDDPDARARFLAIMQEQADRMFRLISDLLSLSRIELDEHSRPKGRIDAKELLESVAAILEMKAAERHVAIRLDVATDLAPIVGDKDQLFQVFQNLIDNAVKYGGKGTQEAPKTVTVRAAPREGNRIAVDIMDEGPGIPANHIPRLTERFYRVDAARSRELGGTGLGLAIVKHIVNRHRGRLVIQSKEGEGSTFTVILPTETGEG